MLDIGAGAGSVTQTVASVLGVPANEVRAVETSPALRRSLEQRGFHAVASLDELGASQTFDAVTLFHVLDRCDEPRNLLTLAGKRVSPGGLLLVATPLPFCAKVWSGGVGSVMASRAPTTPMVFNSTVACAARPHFEAAAGTFVASALGPLLEREMALVAWTRLPYLSCGALTTTHHAMDSAVFILSRR
jgi:SAM-dependent methyltransferase